MRRALERCISSGKELAQIKSDLILTQTYPTFSKEMVWLDQRMETLETNSERTENMLSNGMIEETRMHYPMGWPSIQACLKQGYREVGWFLDGRLNRDELKNAIASATRKLVGKQRNGLETVFLHNREFYLDRNRK